MKGCMAEEIFRLTSDDKLRFQQLKSLYLDGCDETVLVDIFEHCTSLRKLCFWNEQMEWKSRYKYRYEEETEKEAFGGKLLIEFLKKQKKLENLHICFEVADNYFTEDSQFLCNIKELSFINVSGYMFPGPLSIWEPKLRFLKSLVCLKKLTLGGHSLATNDTFLSAALKMNSLEEHSIVLPMVFGNDLPISTSIKVLHILSPIFYWIFIGKSEEQQPNIIRILKSVPNVEDVGLLLQSEQGGAVDTKLINELAEFMANNLKRLKKLTVNDLNVEVVRSILPKVILQDDYLLNYDSRGYCDEVLPCEPL